MSRMLVFLSLFSLIAGGCQPGRQSAPAEADKARQLLLEQFDHEPHNRAGTYPSPTVLTHFQDPFRLGSHHYEFNLSEKNGIVYTCKAGHIDIYHVREAADWTAFLAAKTFKHLSKDDTEFSFRLKEGSICFVRLTYPKFWAKMTQECKENAAYNISVGLGEYFSYIAGTWHEIVTWYGYKSGGIYPEFPSAFSWEDSFSNILGCHIGASALQDSEHTYDEAMTSALNSELEKLEVQPHEVARLAAESVEGIWFSGHLPGFVDMKKRNFDIGIDNGFVTPSIVPDICECKGAKPQPYRVPTLDCLSAYGLSMKFEIKPREWEKDKILSIIYPDKETRGNCIEPVKDFATIMNHIKKEAEKRYGPVAAGLSIH